MKLYIKQKAFSWKDKFRVYDAYENDLFYAEGEIFTWGRKLHLYDSFHRELAFIHQKVWSFLPRYFINIGGTDVAEVVRHITFLHPRYSINGFGWEIEGNFSQHEYSITQGAGTIATISKKWFAWGDTYEIDIPGAYDTNDFLVTQVLSVLIALDGMAADSAAAASGGAS